MLLYTTNITPRLEYISAFISPKISGEKLQLTNDIEMFKSYDGAKINYTQQRITPGELWIKPYTLLFEKNIYPQTVKCIEINGNKVFFKTDGDYPFDIFAASFYLLSRYEEYLPNQKDMYGRYAHENSLACKEGFLNLPLINIWLEEFKKSLREKFPIFNVQNSVFRFIPTYDIDEAYSYKYKGVLRTTGAIGKAVLRGQWKKIIERRNVVKGVMPDPFDSFDWMDQLHERYKLEPRYFFLVSEKTGKYDRNILPSEPALQQLIKLHAEKYETGIHPSWQSGDNTALLTKEIKTLENITGKKIESSRQHFIRLSLPHTFRRLLAAGIKEDYSMGYGTINGFRASVASPFYWYDLEKDETTDLQLYPFCFMEANSFFEQKFSPQQAIEEMRYYYQQVKLVNGTLVTLWHNTFLGTDKLFSGWREVYEQFITEVTGNKNIAE